MSIDPQISSSTGLTDAVKTRMQSWLTNKGFQEADVGAFIKKLDGIAGHESFRGKDPTIVELGLQRTVEKTLGGLPGNSSVTVLHPARHAALRLDQVTVEDLTKNVLNTTPPANMYKPSNDNVLTELRRRAAAPQKPTTIIERKPGFMDLGTPDKVWVGLISISAGFLLAQGIQSMWAAYKARDNEGQEGAAAAKPAYSQFAAGAIVTLMGAGTAYLAHHHYSTAIGQLR